MNEKNLVTVDDYESDFTRVKKKGFTFHDGVRFDIKLERAPGADGIVIKLEVRKEGSQSYVEFDSCLGVIPPCRADVQDFLTHVRYPVDLEEVGMKTLTAALKRQATVTISAEKGNENEDEFDFEFRLRNFITDVVVPFEKLKEYFELK